MSKSSDSNPGDWNIDASWTLFLDRDGVINERIMSAYVTSIEEFHFLPGVTTSIAVFSEIFQYVFVVTNQQGIAKGIMTERNLSDIHAYMQSEVEKVGGRINKCYYAPGMASAKNELRKPKPGMAYLAQRQFSSIDFSKSIMIGDSDSDIVFGKNLGMKTVRVATVEPIHVEADFTVNSLEEFAKWIIK
jgi:D-glycero-D-manno-heptose 1,7-bisphosphate phosphatase